MAEEVKAEKTIDTKSIQVVFASSFYPNRDIDRGRYRYDNDDLLLVKEKKFDEHGNVKKRIRLIENFERPFWVVKPKYRTYKDKREWESLDRLDEYKSTQRNLSYSVQKALGRFNPDPKLPIRQVNRSPYVYGTDLTPAYFIKEFYSHKYNNFRAGETDIAILDIETDVVTMDDGAIICLSLVYHEFAYVYALRRFIGSTTLNYENEFFEILDRDIPEVRGQHGYQVELKIFDDEAELIKATFAQLHEWKPDIVTGWNVLMFDVQRLVERMEHHGLDPAVLFSDPMIPDKYKNYRFKEGKLVAVSDSGKKTNLAPIERWHEVIAPASFQWIDAMCTYYQIRKAKGMESSYALDVILNNHLKRGKYEIDEAEKQKGLAKHIFMQKRYPVHYCVYNLYDSIGVDLLDKKTGDLRSKFYILLGDSETRSFQSNPSKLKDGFHSFLYRKRGLVIGSTSDQMSNEMDERLPPLDGWIVALPTVLLKLKGTSMPLTLDQ